MKKNEKTHHYFEVSLKLIIRQWMKDSMKDDEWEVLAVDPVGDNVVFRRFGYE